LLAGLVMLATWCWRHRSLGPLLLISRAGGARWFQRLADRLDRLGFRGPLLVVTWWDGRPAPRAGGRWPFSLARALYLCGLILGGAAAAAGLQQP